MKNCVVHVVAKDPETGQFLETTVVVPDVFAISPRLHVGAISVNNPESDIILNFGEARWKISRDEHSGVTSFDPA